MEGSMVKISSKFKLGYDSTNCVSHVIYELDFLIFRAFYTLPFVTAAYVGRFLNLAMSLKSLM